MFHRYNDDLGTLDDVINGVRKIRYSAYANSGFDFPKLSRSVPISFNSRFDRIEESFCCLSIKVSEATQLKTSDIDRARMQLRVRDGKGAKGRVLPLSERLLKSVSKLGTQAATSVSIAPRWSKCLEKERNALTTLVACLVVMPSAWRWTKSAMALAQS